MLKSKLLVSVTLCAVFGLASARAYGPQDESNSGDPFGTEVAASDSNAADTKAAAESAGRAPRFEYVANDATPENRWLHEMLSKPIPPLDFPGEVPLVEILETVSTYYTSKFGAGAGPDGGGFRMTIYPDFAELDLEGISSLEDVIVADISFEGMRLDNALKLIFEQTIDPELTYIIENQVIKVTTLAKAQSEDNLVTRVFNVGELADLKFRAGEASRLRVPKVKHEAPAKGGGVGYFSVPAEVASEKTAPVANVDNESPVLTSDLESLILEMTAPPARWFVTDGEGGSIRLIGHLLFVRQTRAVQQQIVHLLNLLDRDSTYETRVYKVGSLAELRISADHVFRPPNSQPRSFDSRSPAARKSKQAPVADANLETLIVEMTGGHWSSPDGRGGAIRRVGQNLVIRQTATVHSQIVELLELLSNIDKSEDVTSH